VAAGYLLFGLYSIALTELFRREILRRGWLDATGRAHVPRPALGL